MKKRIIILFFIIIIESFSLEKMELEKYNIKLKEVLIKNKLDEYRFDEKNDEESWESDSNPLVKYIYIYYDVYEYYQKRIDELENYKSEILKKLNTPKGFDVEIGIGRKITPYYKVKYEFIIYIDLDKIIKGELK